MIRLQRPLPCLLLTLLLGIAGLTSPLADPVKLRTGTLDPGAEPKATKSALAGISGGSEGRALVIVQFSGPIQEAWLEAARNAGARTYNYIPDNSYLMSIAPDKAAGLNAGVGLSWSAGLPAKLKMAPRLAPAAGSGPEAVQVLSVEGNVSAELAKLGVKVASARLTPMGWHETKATLNATQIDAAARLWNVFLIDREPVRTMHGERSAQTVAGQFDPAALSPRGPGYVDWLATQGLTGGAGLIAQVMDDGLDRGDSSNQPGTAHPDIVGRIAGIFNATSDALGDSAAGHGHINAGIIMANAATGVADAAGFRRGQGIAPAAKVYATKIFANNGFFDIGSYTITDLVKNAHDAGATFSSNSWGSKAQGNYFGDSAEFDALARDCDPATPGYQPMRFFISAGNSGPDSESVGSPGTAKNVVTVGAGENSDADGNDGCSVPPAGADSIRDLINFSSRGPNTDGRLGVTLFTVGTHVEGPASQAPGYDGSGVCDTFWPIGQTLYARSSGTSHSCPAACGTGMVVYEFFQSKLSVLGHTGDPSPALIRAALVNSATDMGGGSNGAGGALSPIPNTMQGWGSLNMDTLFSMREGLYTFDQRKLFTESGQQWSKTLYPVTSSKPIKVTLAWTDPPGLPLAGKALVNDLDLVVQGQGGTYLGNVFNGGLSGTGGTADRLNNLECVYIANPSGPFTITVKATNIAGDALTQNLSGLDQDFSLIVWNGTDVTPQGALEVVKEELGCGQELQLRLTDSDLKGTGNAAVQTESPTGDVETVNLAETSAGSGVFTGRIVVEKGDAGADGVLRVGSSGKITVTYQNADNGAGGASTLLAYAGFNCSPPEITDVTIEGVGIGSARVGFTTSKASTGKVIGGQACGASDFNTDAGQGTRHEALIAGLLPCTRYRFRVEAQDEFGSVGSNDNGGRCFSFVTASEGAVELSDGFDPTAAAGWTHSAENSHDNWHVLSNALAHSPTNVYSFQPSPDVTESTRLVTPSVHGGGRLTFWHTFALESTYDGARVEVSTDGGGSWTDLGPYILSGGYNGRPAAFGDGGQGWTGGTSFALMSQVAVDLAAFSGNILIGFHLSSDLGVGSPGWLIDDVQVTGVTLCPSALGSLSFNAAFYSGGSDVALTLVDTNAGDGPLPAAIRTKGGDEETLQLVKIDAITYRGTLTVARGGSLVVKNNGKIEAGSNDEVTATLLDADDGDGGSTPLTARASVSTALAVDSLTELFEQNDNDLAHHAFTFTPDGSPNYYAVCSATISAFEIDPQAGATKLTFADDSDVAVALTGGAQVKLFGQSYGSVRVNDNGHIYFAPGGSAITEALQTHFAVPRVSALFDDLNSSFSGTGVFSKQTDDRLVISYLGVQEFGRPTSFNTFQIEFFFDGRIRLSYLDIGVKDGLIGLSRGTGTPAGFVESDFTAYPTDCSIVGATPDQIRRYLLGIDTNPAGLDLNADGAVDAADLAGALARFLTN